MTGSALTIGQLASRTGVNASAIRYYERVGVLPPPDRIGGQRRYDTAAVRRLEILAVAKRATFTLDEARRLLQRGDGRAVRDLAQRRLPELDARIARAEAERAWLLAATECSCETLDACRLFDAAR